MSECHNFLALAGIFAIFVNQQQQQQRATGVECGRIE